MQKFIEFFELDKDGTWFVILAVIAAVMLVIFAIKGIILIIENVKFRNIYGVTLTEYCKQYDISDRDYAWEDAARRKEYTKAVSDITRNEFLIPQTGITMAQAVENMKELSRVLGGI